MKTRDGSFSVKLSSERVASVVLRDKFFAFFVASSCPRLPSSGICTRANYPSPPLKLEQNLLRRRIGAPRPPVLPVQQPGMPPSTAELVFKRRPRLERVATLRAPRPRVLLPHSFAYPRSPSILRYTNSAQCFAMERELASSSSSSPLLLPLPPPPPPPPLASPPRARPVSRIAIQRREDRLAVLQRKKEREKRARRSDAGARGRTREPVRESRYGARNGDGLIRGARVRRRKVDR